jgi:hypothetical protein
LVEIVIPRSVEQLGIACFADCRSLSFVIFESKSQLSEIEDMAFLRTGLIEIVIPASIQHLGRECFAECRSLLRVTFQSGSRLSGIERRTFIGIDSPDTLHGNRVW